MLPWIVASIFWYVINTTAYQYCFSFLSTKELTGNCISYNLSSLNITYFSAKADTTQQNNKAIRCSKTKFEQKFETDQNILKGNRGYYV